MRYFYFLIILTAYTLNGQTPLDTLLNNNWKLIEYDDGSELGMYDFLSNPELNQISLSFFMDNETLKYQTKVCRTKTGTVGEIEEDGSVYKLTFGDFEIEGTECTNPESQLFESAYFGHIYDEFEYWFYFVEQENGSIHLNISSSHFCTATFTNEVLSNQEIDAKTITLYPNPVKETLNIENPDLKIMNLELLNSEGKIILQKAVNQKEIALNFNPFPKGIYYLKLRLENGRVQTEKIIKK